MQLPKPLTLPAMQSQWSAVLNPLLANPLNSINILNNISLIDGVTVINHGLQRNLQGWLILDQNAAASIYRSAPLNNLTLTLTSSAACVVSIGVF